MGRWKERNTQFFFLKNTQNPLNLRLVPPLTENRKSCQRVIWQRPLSSLSPCRRGPRAFFFPFPSLPTTQRGLCGVGREPYRVMFAPANVTGDVLERFGCWTSKSKSILLAFKICTQNAVTPIEDCMKPAWKGTKDRFRILDSKLGRVFNRAFSLMWPASMQIYRNKRKRLHKKKVQPHRIGFEHQHGRHFIVLKHQYGRRDVIWIR